MATNFSNRRSRKLSIQPLEERALMAGDVAAIYNNGVLTLKGDAKANDIAVYQQINNGVPVSGSFLVTGVTANGELPTTVNGRPSSPYFTKVKQINVSLGGGDDHITLGIVGSNGTPAPFNLVGPLSIDMGDGTNKVDLIGTAVGATTINSGDLIDTINVSGRFSSLSINPHGSGDIVSVNNTTVTNGLNIIAGTGTGNDIVLVKNTTVNDLIIDMGDSTSGDFYDTVNIDHLTANHDVTLLGGAGKHSYSIDHTTIKDALFATLGDGEDGVEIANTTVTTKAELRLGGGNDTMKISDSNFGSELDVDMGVGDDTLTVTNVTADFAFLEGHADFNDRLFRSDLHLNALYVHGFAHDGPA